jgi:hypothetical protein
VITRLFNIAPVKVATHENHLGLWYVIVNSSFCVLAVLLGVGFKIKLIGRRAHPSIVPICARFSGSIVGNFLRQPSIVKPPQAA